jgi:hypothetical protein
MCPWIAFITAVRVSKASAAGWTSELRVQSEDLERVVMHRTGGPILQRRPCGTPSGSPVEDPEFHTSQ